MKTGDLVKLKHTRWRRNRIGMIAAEPSVHHQWISIHWLDNDIKERVQFKHLEIVSETR